jgi:hypothetical protein
MGLRTFGLERRDLLVVIGSFAASRVLYALLGVSFDASTFPHYMQFIDADLLANRFLESLWYFHAHPPLLNVFVGLGYKIFGAGAEAFFSMIFHALGVLIALSVYTLTLRLSSSRVAAGITTVLLVFSPAFVLYENWLMYTFPAVALLTTSALLLYQYVLTRKTSWCVAFFGVLAALLLTRSLFHVAWLMVIIALLTLVLWERRWQVLAAAAVPLLVVLFWYGKNYVLFGTFSSSTMLGIGLSNITTLVVPRADLEPLVETGTLSPFALVSRYEERYVLFASQPHLQPSGIAVLDQVHKADGTYNYNNVQMVAMNRFYTQDALQVVRHFPYSYVLGLVISNRLFFSPPSMNAYFSHANREAARPLELVFNPLLYGARPEFERMQQPHFGLPSRYQLEVNTSIPLLVMWWTVLGYAYMQARRVLKHRSSIDARTAVMGFFVVTALYLYVVGTAFELAENYRYRYNIEPLFLVVTAVAVTDLVRAVRASFLKRRLATQSRVS